MATSRQIGSSQMSFLDNQCRIDSPPCVVVSLPVAAIDWCESFEDSLIVPLRDIGAREVPPCVVCCMYHPPEEFCLFNMRRVLAMGQPGPLPRSLLSLISTPNGSRVLFPARVCSESRRPLPIEEQGAWALGFSHDRRRSGSEDLNVISRAPAGASYARPIENSLLSGPSPGPRSLAARTPL